MNDQPRSANGRFAKAPTGQAGEFDEWARAEVRRLEAELVPPMPPLPGVYGGVAYLPTSSDSAGWQGEAEVGHVRTYRWALWLAMGCAIGWLVTAIALLREVR